MLNRQGILELFVFRTWVIQLLTVLESWRCSTHQWTHSLTSSVTTCALRVWGLVASELLGASREDCILGPVSSFYISLCFLGCHRLSNFACFALVSNISVSEPADFGQTHFGSQRNIKSASFISVTRKWLTQKFVPEK